MKRADVSKQAIPRWAYLLFVLLAAFVLFRIFQHRATEAEAAQPPVRSVLVAKVITKDVPLYLDEIGTCAAYETVQVQAQVSGQIIARNFQDGADVKQGDLLFTIDPRPYQWPGRIATRRCWKCRDGRQRRRGRRSPPYDSGTRSDLHRFHGFRNRLAARAALSRRAKCEGANEFAGRESSATSRRSLFHRHCCPTWCGHSESARRHAEPGPWPLAIGICARALHSG